jgi:hypothetical protein
MGDPSDFFDKKPAWKRLERGMRSMDGSGGVGIGEEPCFTGSENDGGAAISAEEISGVASSALGVAWNSASVPFSVSSRHLTPLFSPLIGDFFFGVKLTPFLALPNLARLRGDDFIGEGAANSVLSVKLGLGIALRGDGPRRFTGPLRFGVPALDGAKTSVTGRPPSGLMTWDTAVEHEVMSLPKTFFAA